MEGSQVDEDPSESELEPAQRGRDTLRDAGLQTSSDSDSEEEGPGEDEHGSPPGTSGHQRAPYGGCDEMGSHPPGLSISSRQEGSSIYSRMWVNLVESIKNSRKCEASRDVLDAFSGPPKRKYDPDHIRLKGTGWGMAQRVFNPDHIWQTKES